MSTIQVQTTPRHELEQFGAGLGMAIIVGRMTVSIQGQVLEKKADQMRIERLFPLFGYSSGRWKFTHS